jgi:hypothetical protein
LETNTKKKKMKINELREKMKKEIFLCCCGLRSNKRGACEGRGFELPFLSFA